MNTSVSRTCVKWQAKRCGDMAIKLRWFEDEILKTGQTVVSRNLPDKELELDEVEVQFLVY